MVITTNAVLGLIYAQSSFKLNKDGLHKKVYGSNNEPHLLFLTNNVRKIIEVFDIDFDTFDMCNDTDEINKLICSSPYTNINKVLNIKTKEKCIMISEFQQWVNDNPSYNIDGKLRTQRVSDVLGIDIESKVSNMRYLIDNFLVNKRSKMVGVRFLESLPDYNKYNFNEDFRNFIKSKSNYEHMDMVVNKTFEEILGEFKTFINYKD
jgi:hypothetical protein